MRVLLIAYRDDWQQGGSLRVAETLTKGLLLSGVEARLCFLYGAPGPLGSSGLPCEYLNLSSSHAVRHWGRWRHLLRTFRPDVVHAVTPIAWIHLAALGIPYRSVAHVHGAGWRTWLPWRTRAAWAIIRAKTDRFICITDGAKAALANRRLAPSERCTTVYNGVDVGWLADRPDRRTARASLGLPQDALVVGMACRLIDTRGCDDLISIVAQLEPHWHGLIVGDGEDKSRLVAHAKALGVTDRIHFAGYLADVRPAYAAMDAFAFLARYESFGLATAEAMACGVPVFGLDGEGEYRETLVNTRNAVFVPRSNPASHHTPESPAVLSALAAEITKYGHKPESLNVVIATAREHVHRNFSIQSQARQVVAVYQEILCTTGWGTRRAAWPTQRMKQRD